MIRYYKGTVTGMPQKANVPAGIEYSAIDVDYFGNIIFKCDVTDLQHDDIIALGNTEITDVNQEVKNLFGDLYFDEEINKWK